METLDLRDSNSVPAVPQLSRALVAEGLSAAAEGDTEAAQQALEAARELAPRSHEPLAALAVIRAGEGPIPTPGSALAKLQALALRLRGFWGRSTLAGQALLILTLTLVVAAVLGSAALMVRYQALFRHEIFESFRRRFGGEIAGFLGWALLAAPLILTFDLVWAAVYWAFLTWKFLEGRERVIAVLCLVGIGAAPALLSMVERLHRAVADTQVYASVEYMEGLPGQRTVQALEQLVAAEPDAESRLLLGLIYERLGNPRTAIEVYRQLSDDPEFGVKALTNLGNIHYRLDEKDRALESWKKAESMDPSFAPLMYNLSIYYLDQFQFDKRNEYFQRFSDSASEQLRQSAGGEEGGGSLLSAGVDATRIWQRVLEGRTRGLDPAVRAADPLGAILAVPAAVAALLVALYNLILRGKATTRRARSCVKCGRPYCPECKTGQDEEPYCLQCLHLFIKKDGVSPQMRADKVVDIRRHETRRRIHSWLLAVAPGATQMYADRPIQGYLTALLWSVGLALVVLGGRPLTQPALGLEAPPQLAVVAGWLLMGLMWLVSLLRAGSAVD
jgi:tetratricopeptide (TPR) repeat protein